MLPQEMEERCPSVCRRYSGRGDQTSKSWLDALALPRQRRGLGVRHLAEEPEGADGRGGGAHGGVVVQGLHRPARGAAAPPVGGEAGDAATAPRRPGHCHRVRAAAHRPGRLPEARGHQWLGPRLRQWCPHADANRQQHRRPWRPLQVLQLLPAGDAVPRRRVREARDRRVGLHRPGPQRYHPPRPSDVRQGGQGLQPPR
mmetsp:Transcript_70656/g.199498  ORF Transcript_70656/g.199498 Transcript_70656/m.199498 type:complete len:200 (-) Transcript_70656:706-1305(-)